jgi:serine/threonine-protein kinase
MAVVFEAEHADLKKRVAIKVLHPHLAIDEAATARFLREGKAAAQIHHPNVVDVFDVGMHEGLPYLVMERLEGVDLARVVAERGVVPLQELADLMLPVIAAVHAAHDAGIIHRDLKPSNVLVTTSPNGARVATVLDFGISKVTRDPSADVTASEVLLGTVHYLSPEQTRSARSESAASDQYALGVMLYECATGARPFHGTTHYALMHAIVSSSVTPPSVLAPSLPHAFDALVARAMHRDPAKRFASVKGLGGELLAFASPSSASQWRGELGGASAATTPLAQVQSARAKAPRGRRAWQGAALAACVVAAVTAVLAPRGPPPASEAPTSAPRAATVATIVTPQVPPTATALVRAEDATPTVSSAPAASARTRGPARASPSAQAPAAPSGAAERGTNGALIVE